MISVLSLRTSEMNSLLIKMKYILYRIFFYERRKWQSLAKGRVSSQETERKLLKRPPKHNRHGDEKHQQN